MIIIHISVFIKNKFHLASLKINNFNRTKYFCIYILFTAITHINLFAQDSTVIGKVIDSETKQPIAFATILLSPQAEKSTISNINGCFSVRLASVDTVSISCVGYKTQKILRENLTNDIIIFLIPQVYQLQEVVITNIDARNIIAKAHSSLNKNYPSKYPILFGIYRKQVVEDGEYVLFGECNMDVYMPSFGQSRTHPTPDIEISNTRVSENRITFESPIQLLSNSILIPYPDFYYFREKYINDFEWRFDKAVHLEQDSYAYKVYFDGKKLKNDPLNEYSKGYVYVSASDYSILKVYREGVMTLSPKKGGGDTKNIRLITSYNYEKSGAHYQLKYARAEAHFDIYKLDKKGNSYIVTTDYLVQNSRYSHKSSSAIGSRIDPFDPPKNALILDWDSFKTILPDYEKEE